jgi:MFS family permease
MVLWGACSAALALMSTPAHFYVLRSLLGAAEAGFFPGVLFYLTTWIPASRRARFTAMFMSAIGISGVISGPVSGAIMQGLEGVAGLRGWQWMFITEGIPACLMGVIVYLFLADRPSTAKWLSPREREIVEAELASEATDKKVERHASFLGALTDLRVYSLVAMSICLIAGGAGISLWLPTIVRQSGVANVWYIGLLSAIPWAVAIIGQQLWARRSDRIGERRWHAAIPAFLTGLGWIVLPSVSSSVALSLVTLTVMTTGYLCATGPFWTMPARFLSGSAAAGGIALITTAGSIAAFFAPTIVGWVSSTTGSLSLGQYFYGGLMMLGAVIMLAGTRTLSIRETPANVQSLAKA